MKRDAYEGLLTWKDAPRRKPLLLRGARQTGKTYLLRAFGRERYAASHYFNFEQTPDLASLFDRDLDPMRIVRDLSVFAEFGFLPGSSLIILDEIQTCNAALNSLKYFAEDAPQYHVAAAGSLLGVALSTPRSFPVGKVDFIDLHPMTFLEFLDALGEGRYRNLIQEQAVPAPFSGGVPPRPDRPAARLLLRRRHARGRRPLRRQPGRGGGARRAAGDPRCLRARLRQHAPARDVARIIAVWNSLPDIWRARTRSSYSRPSSAARGRATMRMPSCGWRAPG